MIEYYVFGKFLQSVKISEKISISEIYRIFLNKVVNTSYNVSYFLITMFCLKKTLLIITKQLSYFCL